MASARRDAVGPIYPDLPHLTRFNSRPINAEGYFLGSRGLKLPPAQPSGRRDAAAFGSSLVVVLQADGGYRQLDQGGRGTSHLSAGADSSHHAVGARIARHAFIARP